MNFCINEQTSFYMSEAEVVIMRVLLVDDNPDITSVLSEYLEEKGIESEVANDPKVGLKRIKEQRYDLVLLDNHMPGLYGTEIIQILENEKILKDQKIIILSGAEFTPEEIQDLLKKDGVKARLKKPIQLKELFTAITS